jgi:flagellar biosynthesis regulator FlaF
MDIDVFKVLSEPYRAKTTGLTFNRMMIDDCKNAYHDLATSLRNGLSQNVAFGSYLQTIDDLTRSVTDYFNARLQPGETVPPELPFLTAKDSAEGMARLQSLMNQCRSGEERKMLVVSAFAAFCYETRLVWALDGQLHSSAQQLPIILTSEINSYGIWKTIHSEDIHRFYVTNVRSEVLGFKKQQLSRMRAVLKVHMEEIRKLRAASEDGLSKLNAVSETTLSKAASAAQKVDEVASEAKRQEKEISELAGSVATSKENVQSFADALREELKTSTTKELWKNRGDASMRSFRLSAVIIAIMMAAPLISLICFGQGFADAFIKLANAPFTNLGADPTPAQLTAATLSRLILISAPIALYFWAIKLIVRYNSRSLMLMDDARQRHTTMDTYFHLIEKNGATPEERGLMLNALFRPVPGQGPENVEPPSFMELVKKQD